MLIIIPISRLIPPKVYDIIVKTVPRPSRYIFIWFIEKATGLLCENGARAGGGRVVYLITLPLHAIPYPTVTPANFLLLSVRPGALTINHVVSTSRPLFSVRCVTVFKPRATPGTGETPGTRRRRRRLSAALLRASIIPGHFHRRGGRPYRAPSASPSHRRRRRIIILYSCPNPTAPLPERCDPVPVPAACRYYYAFYTTPPVRLVGRCTCTRYPVPGHRPFRLIKICTRNSYRWPKTLFP